MYRPPHFRVDDVPQMHGLMEAHPLGTLVSCVEGILTADPLPFLLERSEGPFGRLVAHFSRANAQLDRLWESPECLVIFQGPEAYISPSWYASKAEHGKVVPTWNYAAVHVWGRATLIEDPAWLRHHLQALTANHESGRSPAWSINDAPDEFIEAQLGGIVGLEISISRMEGKWKMSQNRSAADREGVVRGLAEEAPSVAELVRGGS